MLIRNAEVWGAGLCDLRIADGRIAEMGSSLAAQGAGRVIEAGGAALLPGLHDHHMHLAGLAVRDQSVWCGPPQVEDAAGLAQALDRPGAGWLRGIGYHESVMGLPGAAELDQLVPDRPLRIQHRSGRMWLFNSMGLEVLLAASDPPSGMERENGSFSGRLFDEDRWLQSALASSPPDFTAISRRLAAWGVTGITDMSPRNDAAIAAHFAAQRASGALQQRAVLAGTLELADAPEFAASDGLALGPAKLHLHEADLPPFDDAVHLVAQAHSQGRSVAIHCVSEVELVFALALFEQAGCRMGERIEHCSVASTELVSRIAGLGLQVCVQPHFVFERGDAYRRDVEPRHQADLYRLSSLAAAGIIMSGGSDAPFGGADPWKAMRAVVDRRTLGGEAFGPEEALTPEDAAALFLAEPCDRAMQKKLSVGTPADLILLDRPWREARLRLSSDDLRLTLIGGKLVHETVDQAPV